MLGLNIVEWFGSNIAALLPLRIVRSYQHGVRFWLGKQPESCPPGIWACVPLLWTIDLVDMRGDVVNLVTQTITTKDGKSWSFSANIEWMVVDAVAFMTSAKDVEAQMTQMSMAHIARKVREWDSAEMVTGQREIERSLKESLQRRVKGWGITVHDVGLTDLVQTRAWRLFSDPLV